MINIINSVIILFVAISVTTLVFEVRSLFKKQARINQHFLNILESNIKTIKELQALEEMTDFDLCALADKCEELKKSIKLTDAGVSILYNSYKELESKKKK